MINVRMVIDLMINVRIEYEINVMPKKMYQLHSKDGKNISLNIPMHDVLYTVAVDGIAEYMLPHTLFHREQSLHCLFKKDYCVT